MQVTRRQHYHRDLPFNCRINPPPLPSAIAFRGFIPYLSFFFPPFPLLRFFTQLLTRRSLSSKSIGNERFLTFRNYSRPCNWIRFRITSLTGMELGLPSARILPACGCTGAKISRGRSERSVNYARLAALTPTLIRKALDESVCPRVYLLAPSTACRRHAPRIKGRRLINGGEISPGRNGIRERDNLRSRICPSRKIEFDLV